VVVRKVSDNIITAVSLLYHLRKSTLIKYFTVENFRSLKTENILEFDANLETNSMFAAHPVIGFAGTNASGKTTILQCLSLVFWFMQHSFLRLEEDAEIPCEPFYSLKATPTKFHLIFAKNTLVDGTHKVIEYDYKLEVTQKKVLMEELYYYSPDETPQLAYLRQENEVKFGEGIGPIDTKDLRPNCSLISLAAQFASQEVAKAGKAHKIQSNVNYKGLKEDESKVAMIRKLLENKEFGEEKLLEFLKIADVGIEGVYLKDVDKEEADQFFLEEQLGKTKLPPEVLAKLAKLRNGRQDDKVRIRTLFFKHQIDGNLADFTPEMESAGTLQLLFLLYRMLHAFKEGGVLIVDELELKLHQNLVAYLIGLFQSPSANPQGAQLIFSFHNSSLMEFLKPEQLWFTEKNDQGQTELFSAAQFHDLKELLDDNLEELYRIGRFGATPRGI